MEKRSGCYTIREHRTIACVMGVRKIPYNCGFQAKLREQYRIVQCYAPIEVSECGEFCYELIAVLD